MTEKPFQRFNGDKRTLNITCVLNIFTNIRQGLSSFNSPKYSKKSEQFCCKMGFSLPKQYLKSRSILKDRPRFLGLFSKGKTHSFESKNMQYLP